MKNYYINEKVYGLPKPLKKGHNSSPNSDRIDKEYIHRWEDSRGYVLYRVMLKRQGVYKTKYFKTFKEAKLFRDMLRINKYL